MLYVLNSPSSAALFYLLSPQKCIVYNMYATCSPTKYHFLDGEERLLVAQLFTGMLTSASLIWKKMSKNCVAPSIQFIYRWMDWMKRCFITTMRALRGTRHGDVLLYPIVAYTFNNIWSQVKSHISHIFSQYASQLT